MLRLLRLLLDWGWPMRVVNPLFGRFNPFLPSYRRDPYTVYRRLREQAPVYFHPVFRTWILTRIEDIEGVLRGSHFSVDRTQTAFFQRTKPLAGLDPDFASAITRALLMIDPPDHTRIRRLVNKAFTPRAVETLRPRIERIVDDLIEPMAAAGEFDLIRDFAVPLPVTAICELLGVPTEGRANMKRWSDSLAILVDPFQAMGGGMERAQVAFLELAAYFRGLFAERRREPRDDLISGLVAAEEQGDRLSEIELVSLTMLLMGAGHETTTNLVGNAIVALLRHPAQAERLRDDPSLAAHAVEELLRYDSPVQITDRIVTRECTIGGTAMREGALVGLLLGAANRDPARFADPDTLQLDRPDVRHVAFGGGPHFCVGAALARLEAQVALPRLLQRFPRLHGDLSRVRYTPSIVLRGPTGLPLRA